MKLEEHNKKAQTLLKKAKKEESLKVPWKLVWNSDGPPGIFDLDGKCVCILSTGVLSGAYDTNVIMANVKRLLSGNNE